MFKFLLNFFLYIIDLITPWKKNPEFILISGNKMKIDEISSIIKSFNKNASVKSINIDLDEIQSINVYDVVKHKIIEASKKVLFLRRNSYVICDDTGLHFEKINNFPGALIKFYTMGLTLNGLIDNFSETNAKVITNIGMFNKGKIKVYEGKIYGKIISKTKNINLDNDSLNWDPIFIPNNIPYEEYKNKSYDEIPKEIKNKISPRYLAIKKMMEDIN